MALLKTYFEFIIASKHLDETKNDIVARFSRSPTVIFASWPRGRERWNKVVGLSEEEEGNGDGME